MESSNAWERAQAAITRATERDAAVVTPDTAVSPFDASHTMIIPRADVVRRGPPDPDTTQRLPHGTPHPPAPRPPGDGRGLGTNGRPGPPGGGAGSANGDGRSTGRGGHGPGPAARGGPPEPPTTPVEVSDPALVPVVRVAGGAHPGTSPLPVPEPDRPSYDETPGTPAARRSFWRRLFGRS